MNVSEQAVDATEQASSSAVQDPLHHPPSPVRNAGEVGPADTIAPESLSDPAAAATTLEPPPVVQTPPLPRQWLRLAYNFEFWIVLTGVYVVWSEVGGQGHLDLIAWYLKLVCGVTFAWAAVRMTGAMVENTRAWNRSTVKWFLAVAAISTLIAGITFWYHLHEAPDEPDTDENSATTVRNSAGGQPMLAIVVARDRTHC